MTLLTVSCSTVMEKTGLTPYEARADIELFLATDDPKVENEVLARLEKNDVTHATVKSLLRAQAERPRKKGGLQLGLKMEHNQKQYPYALYVPESTDPGKVVPLVVVLHGLGGNGDTIIQSWIDRFSGEVAILCPSYPMGAWWSKTAEGFVLQLIQEVRYNYAIDYDRVFMMGLSNGAIGAYMLGMFYPDYFAGIVPIAGSITERYMHFLVNLINTPIYMIQGTYDPIFPIAISRRVHQILSDMKSPVIYREHEEKGTAHGGHYLPESEVPGMVAWVKQQTRASNPKVLRMTREANHMDRIHWARLSRGKQLAALQLPGPEKETLNVKNGKIATLFAVHADQNRFELMGKNLDECELFLNEDMVDFDHAIQVTTQEIEETEGQLVPGEKNQNLNQKIEKDMELLLRGFKAQKDPRLLYDAKVKISFEKRISYAFKQ